MKDKVAAVVGLREAYWRHWEGHYINLRPACEIVNCPPAAADSFVQFRTAFLLQPIDTQP